LNLWYYKYPQYLWVQELVKILPSTLMSGATIVDAPCGEGFVTYWLKAKFPANPFLMVDLDSGAIEKVRAHVSGANVRSICGDLRVVLENENFTDATLLLINSLYLLPDPDGLMNLVRRKFKFVVGIFPHIDRKNFQAFLRKNPHYEHTCSMTEPQTVEFFARHGFSKVTTLDVGYIHNHALPRVPVVSALALRFFNLIEWGLPRRPGAAAYWIGVFKRND
jgi:hypothetical protein